MRRVIITDYARSEMGRRQIAEDSVRKVTLAPDQVVTQANGRTVHQSRIDVSGSGKGMPLRVVVKENGDALVVITAYRTSKVEKYWQSEAEA